jgi:phage-related tail fiber protein
MLSAQMAVRNSELSQRVSSFQRASVADGATLTARVFRSSNNGEDNMPAHPSRALITGATGQIGRAVLKQLREDTSVEAVVAARSPEKAAGLGFPVVPFDYDRSETISPALEGIDSIFVVTGYTVDMLRQSKTLVDHAMKWRSRTMAGTSSSNATSNGPALRKPISVRKSTWKIFSVTAEFRSCAMGSFAITSGRVG